MMTFDCCSSNCTVHLLPSCFLPSPKRLWFHSCSFVCWFLRRINSNSNVKVNILQGFSVLVGQYKQLKNVSIIRTFARDWHNLQTSSDLVLTTYHISLNNQL